VALIKKESLSDKTYLTYNTHVRLLGLLAKLRSEVGSLNTATPVAAGIASSAAFKREALRLLDGYTIGFNKNYAIRAKYGLNYPNPDYLFIDTTIGGGRQSARSYGLDFIDLRGMDQGTITKKHILPEIMKSSFFNELWIVHAGRDSWFFCDKLISLGGADNVGLITIADDLSQVVNVVQPRGGPVPDRSRIWLNELSPWLIERIRRKGWFLR